MFWPCEARTSTCRNFATISSGLYRFLAITVLLDVKDIPQVGPLQWGWITRLPDLHPLSSQDPPGSIREDLALPCTEPIYCLAMSQRLIGKHTLDLATQRQKYVAAALQRRSYGRGT